MKITKAEKKQVEYLSRLVIYLFITIFGFFIFGRLLIPLTVQAVRNFATTVQLYKFLDIEAKFFAGIIFTFISFYILKIVLGFNLKIIQFGTEGLLKLNKKKK